MNTRSGQILMGLITVQCSTLKVGQEDDQPVDKVTFVHIAPSLPS